MAPNTMPNLVGQLSDPVVRLMSCIGLEDVDHCLNFLGGDLLEAIGMDPRQLGNFFFTILRSGVRPEVIGDPSGASRIRSQFPAPGEPVPPLSVIKLECTP